MSLSLYKGTINDIPNSSGNSPRSNKRLKKRFTRGIIMSIQCMKISGGKLSSPMDLDSFIDLTDFMISSSVIGELNTIQEALQIRKS